MKAMIFAAGKGTRLKPLTDTMPKALVPVAGMPLIEHVVRKLVHSGVDSFVVNVHHFADQLKSYLPTLAQSCNVRIDISDESAELLETGGGIKHAATLLTTPSYKNIKAASEEEDRFIIHNCDILSNVSIPDFWKAGEAADATLLVSERDTQRYLIFDNDMRLVGWTNIKTGEVKSPYPAVHQAFNPDYVGTEMAYSSVLDPTPVVQKMYHLYAFAGIHQMHTSMLPLMDHWQDRFSIIDFYLEQCATHVIRGYVQPDLQLMDVGKLDTLSQAEQFLEICRK